MEFCLYKVQNHTKLAHALRSQVEVILAGIQEADKIKRYEMKGLCLGSVS